MKKSTILIVILLIITIIYVTLYALEYLRIWNQWSLFISTKDDVRNWVDKSKVVNLFKEKYPDAEEVIYMHIGTHRYKLFGENMSLYANVKKGDIYKLGIRCYNPSHVLCWSSLPPYTHNYTCTLHGNSPDKQMLDYLKSDSCR